MNNAPNIYIIAENLKANQSSAGDEELQQSRFILNVIGTFAGASVAVKVKPYAHAIFRDIAGAIFTDSGAIDVLVAHGDNIMAVVTGGNQSTDVTVTLNKTVE